MIPIPYKDLEGGLLSQKDSELQKKIKRVFVNRTHKFPDKKVEIIQSPETRNERFIIAPYEPAIKKIEALIAQDRTHQKAQLLSAIEKEVEVKLSEGAHLQQYDDGSLEAAKHRAGVEAYNYCRGKVHAILEGFRDQG